MQLIRELGGGLEEKQTFFSHTFIMLRYAKGTHVGDGQCTRCGHVYMYTCIICFVNSKATMTHVTSLSICIQLSPLQRKPSFIGFSDSP